MPEAMRIILNADDLGLSARVNDAVFSLMHARRLTSATILAGGAAFEDACRRLKELPHCSFGVHLNLTELKPETSSPNLAPILNGAGEFSSTIRSVPITTPLARAIESEWIAQIEKVRSMGVPISHLDGHHHIHTYPPLFRTLKRVQQATKITRVRTTMNMVHPSEPGSVGFKKRVLKSVWHHALKRVPPFTTTTEVFTGLWAFHDRLPDVGTPSTAELMVHPGADFPTYQLEERLMVTPWEERARIPIRLISFNDL